MIDKEIQSNIEETPDAINVIIPLIEDNIPLPKSQKDAMDDISIEKEIEIRAETIKTLSDIKGEPIEPNSENAKQAKQLAEDMINNKDLRPDFASYPNETMAYLAGMVAQTNVMLTKEMADYKLYVLNNAVYAHESATTVKDKISALRLIGEVDGVDAFKKKTEITHVNKTGKELEDELKKAIEELKGKVVEGQVLEIKTSQILEEPIEDEVEDDDD